MLSFAVLSQVCGACVLRKAKQTRASAIALSHNAHVVRICWAEAHIKIARMTLTIELDGNWNSFQLANSAPPLSVTDSAIAPSARMLINRKRGRPWSVENIDSEHAPERKDKRKKRKEHHSVSRRPFDHQTRSPKNCLEIRGERMNEHHHGDFVGLGCQV